MKSVLVFLFAALCLVGTYADNSYGYGYGGSEEAASANLGISQGTGSYLGSVIPQNGDNNPYGVFIVPTTLGLLTQGNIMVSNFNAASGLQGTGSTLIQFTPAGPSFVFAEITTDQIPENNQCPGGIGLTTALAVLQRGWTIVGSFPTTDGTVTTADRGCLLILDANGNVVSTLWGPEISGPWDLTVWDRGSEATIFFTNIFDPRLRKLTGNQTLHEGFVTRIDLLVPNQNAKGLYPTELFRTRIGSGFELAILNGFPAGPTGVALSRDYRYLFVADTLFNRISRIPNPVFRRDDAFTGEDLSANGFLLQPLGLIVEPVSGHLLTVNNGNGLLIELTPNGEQVDSALITNNGAGALFGLAIENGIIYFADDVQNALGQWVLPQVKA